MSTKAEKQWMSDAASLGCVVCRNTGYGESPAEIHHIKTGCGISQRSNDFLTIPLCAQHHRLGGEGIAFHASPKSWQARYGYELTLLQQTIREIVDLRANTYGRAV